MTQKKVKIYLIRNKINKKVYIGQTKNTLEHRFKQHVTRAKRMSKNSSESKKFFYQLIWDLGEENFEIELLEECNLSSATNREQYYINYYDSTNPEKGYNERCAKCEKNNPNDIADLEKNVLDLYQNKHLLRFHLLLYIFLIYIFLLFSFKICPPFKNCLHIYIGNFLKIV